VTGFLLRALLAAFGLYLATRWVHGVRIDNMETLLLAGLLLGVVNAVVRPIAFVLTLPLTIVTLGLFLLVLNAAMVALVAWILPGWLGSALIGHHGFERYDRRRSPL
jgi:putative membrane protein